MKSKKRKGFTIVEVMAALAILIGGVTVVYAAFRNSSITFAKEKTNLELVSSNQSIAENLKAEGKIRVEEIKTQAGDKIYIFFDNYGEIYTDINSRAVSPSYLTSATVADYGECKVNNTNNKKMGALLLITKKDLTISASAISVYSYYQIDATAWDFKSGNKSQTTFYVGR